MQETSEKKNLVIRYSHSAQFLTIRKTRHDPGKKKKPNLSTEALIGYMTHF